MRALRAGWALGVALAAVGVVAAGSAGCSSGGGACKATGSSLNGAGTGTGGSAIDLCGPSSGSSSGASSSGSSGTGSSGGGSSSGHSGSSSGTGSSSGAGSSSGSGGSSSGTASSGGGGENCQDGQGDFCLCYGPSSTLPANSTPCSTSDLKDPGSCCADPGFPGSGDCICSSFLCYVNAGGGKDCWYQDLGGNGLEVPTTSASGTACCTWGDATYGYICSCYADASACDGKTPVSECTMGTIPACSSDVTSGYTQVPSCR